MHRYSVLVMGAGASVSCTTYAYNRGMAAQQGKARFLEVNPATEPRFVQVEDLGEGSQARHPFEGFARLSATI